MTPSPVEALVRARIGLDPSSLGEATVERVVRDRMAARAASTPHVYAGLLATDPAEWAALLGDLLVGETWFFRGGRPLFDYLAHWVRDRAAAHMTRPVRVLTVPCSTGEEPYSLAIALEEAGVPLTACRIDGVDLSEDHVARAAAGVYAPYAFREQDWDPRPAYLRPVSGSHWELIPRVRQAVRFRVGNLADPAFLAGEFPYDLILCRNLFIYLTADGRGRAIANLERLLAPDGLLCMTPAEADRLPPARFTASGPTAFALFRRAESAAASDPRSGVFSTTSPSGGPRSGVFRAVPAASESPPRSGVFPRPHPVAVAPPPPVDEPTRTTRPLTADSLTIARELADAGKLDEARTVCERETRHGSAPASAFSLLGVIHLAAGRQVDATAAFRKALYLNPDHPEALTHMIMLHEQRGETGPATALRRRLTRLETEGAA